MQPVAITPSSLSSLRALTAAGLLLASASAAFAQEAPAGESASPMVFSLDQAVELALLNNLDLESSRLAAEQADLRVNGSRGTFDPVLSVFYQHAKRVQPTATELDALVSEQASDVFSTSLAQKLLYGASYEVRVGATRSATNNPFVVVDPSYTGEAFLKYTQPLLRGFGADSNLRWVREAINNASIANKSVQSRARDVARDTIAAYWELVFARRDLEVKKASLRLARDLERQNRIMVEVGTLAPLEITQAEAAVASRNQDIILAQAAIGASEDSVRRLIGIEESSAWWDAPLVPADEPAYRDAWVDLSESLAEALERRPEIQSAELDLANDRLAVAHARDSLRPSLNLEGTIETDGLAGDREEDTDGDTIPDTFVDATFDDAFRQVRNTDFNSWTAGLNFSFPLGNRAAKSEYQVARLGLEEGSLGLRRARQTIILDVRKAVRDVLSARERIQAARATRTLQQAKLEAEIRKFENGLSTNFQVLTFQTDLATAESGELRATVDYLEALAALDAARGTLLSEAQVALAWQ